MVQTFKKLYAYIAAAFWKIMLFAVSRDVNRVVHFSVPLRTPSVFIAPIHTPYLWLLHFSLVPNELFIRLLRESFWLLIPTTKIFSMLLSEVSFHIIHLVTLLMKTLGPLSPRRLQHARPFPVCPNLPFQPHWPLTSKCFDEATQKVFLFTAHTMLIHASKPLDIFTLSHFLPETPIHLSRHRAKFPFGNATLTSQGGAVVHGTELPMCTRQL